MLTVVAFPMETTCLVGRWFHLRCFARLLTLLVLLCLSMTGYVFGASRASASEQNTKAYGSEQLQTAAVPQIIINLPEFRLRYYVGGKLAFEGSIAVGSTVTQTQLGDYYVANKAVNPTWHPPDGRPPVPPGPTNPLGPRWMGLDRNGYGIHGTIRPSSIGHAVSMGCIRMKNEDAIKLFDMVSVGTKVKLQYERILLSDNLEPDQSWIRVLPDIYHREGATYDNIPKQEIEQKLSQAGYGHFLSIIDKDLFWSLISVSNGGKVYFPFSFTLSLNGSKVDALGVTYNGETLVPLAKLVKELGGSVSFDKASNTTYVSGQPVKPVVLLGGRSYANLGTLESLLGVAGRWTVKGKAMSLQPGYAQVPTLTNTYAIRISGKNIGQKGFKSSDGLMVPVRSICDTLGIKVEWDKFGSVIWPSSNPDALTSDFKVIKGKAYMSVSELEKFLGVAIGVDEIDKAIDINPDIKFLM